MYKKEIWLKKSCTRSIIGSQKSLPLQSFDLKNYGKVEEDSTSKIHDVQTNRQQQVYWTAASGKGRGWSWWLENQKENPAISKRLRVFPSEHENNAEAAAVAVDAVLSYLQKIKTKPTALKTYFLTFCPSFSIFNIAKHTFSKLVISHLTRMRYRRKLSCKCTLVTLDSNYL